MKEDGEIIVSCVWGGKFSMSSYKSRNWRIIMRIYQIGKLAEQNGGGDNQATTARRISAGQKIERKAN